MTGVRKMFYLDMSNTSQEAYLNSYYAAPENSHYYSNEHFYLQ